MNFAARLKLTAAEEQELTRQAQAGDQAARDRLVRSHLPLVCWVARPFRRVGKRKGLDPSDLISAGSIGLVKAIDAYDPTRGFRFATFAASWIDLRIRRAVRESGWPIRLPVYLADSAAATNHPQAWAIAQQIKHLTRCDRHRWYSLEAREPPAVERLEHQELIHCVRAVVASLPEPQAQVVRLYYGIDCDPLPSARLIAQQQGKTHQTILNWLNRAKATLAERLTSRGLVS